MSEIERLSHETELDYIKRLINLKSDHLIDTDYVELSPIVFNQELSSCECRKRMYGAKYIVDLYEGYNSKHKHILHISDLHIPFQREDIMDLLRPYKDKIDILEFNGDVQDCQSISKFVKKYRKPFIDELVESRQVMIEIIEMINPKEVVINYGNHESRLLSYLSEKVNEEIMALMPEASIELITDMGFTKYDHENKTRIFYEPLVKIFENKIKITYTKDWFNQIGDTIFCHPKAFKSGILATTQQAYLYFLQKGMKFSAIVMAHTHALAFSRYGDCFLYEGGCLCKQQDYSDGKLSRPQSPGFMLVTQDEEGKIIYDETKLINL